MLSAAERLRWGSYEWSFAITGESAHQLGIEGFRRVDLPRASEIAAAFLREIEASEPTDAALYSGHAMATERLDRLLRGATVRFPLTSLSKEEKLCRIVSAAAAARKSEGAETHNAVLLQFESGIRAMRYNVHEWITAGDFDIVAVEHSKEPMWQVPLVRVACVPANARR